MKTGQPRYDREKHLVARKLRESLNQGAEADRQRVHQHLQTLDPLLDNLQRQIRRLNRAGQHGLSGARDRILHRLPTQQSNLQYELELLGNILRRPGRHVPSLRELVAELDQLTEEFGEWVYRSQSNTLSVETEPIVLEGVELGPFAIELPIVALTRADPQTALEAVPRAPNPASGSPGVTHPHVSDERICLGEACGPVRRALCEGRLSDAFLLVRSLLHHYNAESPYVPIEDWHTEPCEDCGAAMDDEQRRCCDICERNYCPDCMSRCEGCDSPACLACVGSCDHCGDSLCRDCQHDGLCETCFQEMENEDDQEDPNYELTGQADDQQDVRSTTNNPPNSETTTQTSPAAQHNRYEIAVAVRPGRTRAADASVHTVRLGEAPLSVSPR